MMMYPNLLIQLAEARSDELQAQARNARLAREARAARKEAKQAARLAKQHGHPEPGAWVDKIELWVNRQPSNPAPAPMSAAAGTFAECEPPAGERAR